MVSHPKGIITKLCSESKTVCGHLLYLGDQTKPIYTHEDSKKNLILE